ncbi:MAG: LamG-like jellyroll fold domain-containing protein, partial [Tepidisphaeraceae bacterium]
KATSASLVVWFTAKDITGFARVLDIGDKDGANGQAFIYYTPKNADGQARAAITATDTASKTFIDSPPLDDGKQHMVAIVIDGAAKKLHVFVDGKEPVSAADLGDNTLDKVKATHSWIGRSGFDQDPGLTGSIKEFRVYDQALTLDQAAAMAKAGPDTLPADAAKP